MVIKPIAVPNNDPHVFALVSYLDPQIRNNHCFVSHQSLGYPVLLGAMTWSIQDIITRLFIPICSRIDYQTGVLPQQTSR